MLRSNETIFHENLSIFKSKLPVLNVVVLVKNNYLTQANSEGAKYVDELHKLIRAKCSTVKLHDPRVQILYDGDEFRVVCNCAFQLPLIEMEFYADLIDSVNGFIQRSKKIRSIIVELGKTEFIDIVSDNSKSNTII